MGVDSPSLFQGIFLTQGPNQGLLHCRWILYCLSHQNSLFELIFPGSPVMSSFGSIKLCEYYYFLFHKEDSITLGRECLLWSPSPKGLKLDSGCMSSASNSKSLLFSDFVNEMKIISMIQDYFEYLKEYHVKY